jgi:hypothetical protein
MAEPLAILPNQKSRFSIAVAVVVLLLAGVGTCVYVTQWSGSVKAGVVPLDQLPAGYLDIAKKQLPNVSFDAAWRLKNGNYEIRGKDDRGKGHEVELDAQGKIVEVD